MPQGGPDIGLKVGILAEIGYMLHECALLLDLDRSWRVRCIYYNVWYHDALIICNILFSKFNAAIMDVISISKAITVIFISTISLNCKVIATEVRLDKSFKIPYN